MANKSIQVGDFVTVKSGGKIIAKKIRITAIEVTFNSATCKIETTLNQ